MRRFIVNVIKFAVGIVVLLGIAEYLARTCPNAYAVKQEWMDRHRVGVETLVLGSSHAYAGIMPQYLGTEAYNLANSSQTQRYDWLLLSRDTSQLAALKAIIYPASSLRMCYRLEDTSEWYRCIYYQLYNHLSQHGALSKYGLEVSSLQTCCWKVQSRLLSGAADRMCDDYGWCTFYQAREDGNAAWSDKELAERFAKYAERDALCTSRYVYFDSIAQYCERHDVKLILVGFPVSKAFAEAPAGQNIIREADSLSLKYASRYSCIRYLDFTRCDSMTDSDFFDVDHLNSNGARKLTEMIRDSI